MRELTVHFANRKSISPLRSACRRGCSLRERRRTRAATARYRLKLRTISTPKATGYEEAHTLDLTFSTQRSCRIELEVEAEVEVEVESVVQGNYVYSLNVQMVSQ